MKRDLVVLLAGLVLALTGACGSVTGTGDGGRAGSPGSGTGGESGTAGGGAGEWERLARAGGLAEGVPRLEEQPAPQARADMEERPVVTQARGATEPEALLVDTAAARRDTVRVEAPEQGRAGALAAMVVPAEEAALALEAPVAALVVRGPVVVAALAPAPRTPAQLAAPAVHAAPSAFVPPGEALAAPDRRRRDTWTSPQSLRASAATLKTRELVDSPRFDRGIVGNHGFKLSARRNLWST